MSKIQHLGLLFTVGLSITATSQTQITIGEVTNRTAYFSAQYYNDAFTPSLCLISGNKLDTLYPRVDYNELNHHAVLSFRDLHPSTNYQLIEQTPSGQNQIAAEISTPSLHPNLDIPLTFIAGSCSYVNDTATYKGDNPYGGQYEIYTAMAREEARFNLWLGDNVYQREGDYTSAFGMNRRYKIDRTNVNLQMLLTSRPNIAIADDHDAGPNDLTGSFQLLSEGMEAFRQHWPRTKYGLTPRTDNRWVSVYDDVVIIGLDNRTHRTSHESSTPQILGKEQIDWLIEQVLYFKQKSSFVFIAIGGQVLSTAQVYENYSRYPEERTYLLTQLAATECPNIVFLTGDRHHSETSLTTDYDGVRMIDFTISPFTSGVSNVAGNEENTYRKGDVIVQRNYAVITISGEPGNRVLSITFKDHNGAEILSYEFFQL